MVEMAVESVVEVAAVLLVVVQPLLDVAEVITLLVRMTEAGTVTTTEETATEMIAHVAPMIGKSIFRLKNTSHILTPHL